MRIPSHRSGQLRLRRSADASPWRKRAGFARPTAGQRSADGVTYRRATAGSNVRPGRQNAAVRLHFAGRRRPAEARLIAGARTAGPRLERADDALCGLARQTAGNVPRRIDPPRFAQLERVDEQRIGAAPSLPETPEDGGRRDAAKPLPFLNGRGLKKGECFSFSPLFAYWSAADSSPRFFSAPNRCRRQVSAYSSIDRRC